MTDVGVTSARWLALREAADARARSVPLARDVSRTVRATLVVHDIGSGTGSMMRWLAPRLTGPQTWVLHDWDPALLEHAARGRATDSAGRAVVVQTSVEDIADLRADALAGASLVTTSALLDVLTREEVQALVTACIAAGAPALFGLSVTGDVDVWPPDAGDRVFESAFNAHQRRTTGGRTLLGPAGVTLAIDLFMSAGWTVRVDDSPWRLDAGDRPLVAEWLDGWIAAAVEERPALREWAGEYQRTRMTQLDRGALKVVVHHRDVLAWPR